MLVSSLSLALYPPPDHAPSRVVVRVTVRRGRRDGGLAMVFPDWCIHGPASVVSECGQCQMLDVLSMWDTIDGSAETHCRTVLSLQVV